MKNKKLATLSVALGLSTIVLIGGISAYFTDADTSTNEFTIGKVSLDLQEPNWVLPTNILPNQVIPKDPQVLNNGINDEFVFLTVEVPIKNIVTAELDGTKKPVADTELFTYEINENWIQVDNDMKNSNSVIRIYAYAKDNQCIPLKKDEITTPLFNTVKFCNTTEDQGLEGTKEQIVINAYGIQTNDINDGDGIDKTSPSEVWKVIKKQQNIKTIQKKVSMVSGSDFNKVFSENFSNATSIHFVENRTVSDEVTPIDFSGEQNNSILGWQEGTAVYISSDDKIIANEDCSDMFYNLKDLIEIQFENFDTSKVVDMSGMFCLNMHLIKLDLSKFNTSNVTTMSDMFRSCHDLTELNVNNFDTSNVTEMREMFAYCDNLTEIDISSFDMSNVYDTSNVTGTYNMFRGCDNLKIAYVRSQTEIDKIKSGYSWPDEFIIK